MHIQRTTGAVLAFALAAGFVAAGAVAGAREEGRLLTATEVLEEVQGMPDQRLPDLLLAHAYGIAVIPDVDKVAFIFGGRRGKGVLVVRDSLNSPWSNPSFVTLTGGSWGLQIGAQSSDIILVFTTKAGVEGLAGGRLTLGADASVADPSGAKARRRPTSISIRKSIPMREPAVCSAESPSSVLNIDRTANAALYGKSGVTATEIFAAQSPNAPAPAQRFLERLSAATRTSVRGSPAPQADLRPTAPPGSSAEAPRTYPLEEQPVNPSAPSAPPQ